ncbi:MAG TPA: VWA domain-containing protein [Bryobacteraceae bacterium]|jgi:VWFA-related protein
MRHIDRRTHNSGVQVLLLATRQLSTALCFVSLAISAQDLHGGSQAGSIPTLKANVRQVLVPVAVTDKKGHPVSGLKRTEFVVFEDGAPQQVVAFSKTYDASLETTNQSPGSVAATARSVVAPAERVGVASPTRTYLVCVDTLHSSIANLTQARHALTKFFQREQDEKAQYALINLGRQIEVIQDSTRDPSSVLAALASKKFQRSVVDSGLSDIVSQADILRKMLLGELPIPGPDLKHQVEMFITSRAERTAILTRNFQQALKNVINATASIPTQRTIVLISDGFNLVPGRELVGIARAYFPEDPEFRFTERDTQPQLNELLRLAQKNNVIVYALDSRGLYPPASAGVGDASHSGDARMPYQSALNEMMKDEDTVAWENGSAMAQLAAATGGIYFHDNNDLLAGLHRAFNDERERYVIAYSPSNPSLDGRYRRIRVEVKDKNLRVYAKSGYWATSE